MFFEFLLPLAMLSRNVLTFGSLSDRLFSTHYYHLASGSILLPYGKLNFFFVTPSSTVLYPSSEELIDVNVYSNLDRCSVVIVAQENQCPSNAATAKRPSVLFIGYLLAITACFCRIILGNLQGTASFLNA